ncbi:MAG TPA: hypothetical protein VFU19_10115 [Iamia sp.]|nr:hypothetical protein [Iamia sp.]
MRRRPTLTVAAALCALALAVAGCGGDDGDDRADGTTTTTAGSSSTAGETTTTGVAVTAEVDCEAYATLTGLFGEADQIASGGNDGQVAADEALDEAVEALQPAAVGDDELMGALDTVAEVSFQVTDDPDAGPDPADVDAALTAIDAAWADTCAVGADDVPPATDGSETEPTTTEADPGTGATVPECPAPEVLEAEGFSCDAEGNLVPLDEETVEECPAPEVLEAEGYSCDAEGHLTPIE